MRASRCSSVTDGDFSPRSICARWPSATPASAATTACVFLRAWRWNRMRSPIGISGWLSTRSAYGGTITSDHGMVDGHMKARTLVLWDVDHTLIETRGVGGELFREAFEQATGHKLGPAPDATPRTDPPHFRATADLHPPPSPH